MHTHEIYIKFVTVIIDGRWQMLDTVIMKTESALVRIMIPLVLNMSILKIKWQSFNYFSVIAIYW